MSSIDREDTIEILKDLQKDHLQFCLIPFRQAIERVQALPSADRPQGDVDAVDIFEREMHNLEQGYITLGEFDERIEPLRHLCYGRPQGEWKPKNHHTDYCSNCGFEETQWRTVDYNFCPSCGARMKGVDDEHTI